MKESIGVSREQLEQMAKMEREMAAQCNALKQKRQSLPSAVTEEQQIESLLLEQEIWLKQKEWQRLSEEFTEKRFAIEQSIEEQEFLLLRLVADLDSDALSAYERLVEVKKRPIAEVKNKACTGCFMVLTPNKVNEWRRGKELVYCEECGCILV